MGICRIFLLESFHGVQTNHSPFMLRTSQLHSRGEVQYHLLLMPSSNVVEEHLLMQLILLTDGGERMVGGPELMSCMEIQTVSSLSCLAGQWKKHLRSVKSIVQQSLHQIHHQSNWSWKKFMVLACFKLRRSIAVWCTSHPLRSVRFLKPKALRL